MIYESLEYLEKKNNFKVDLLLICGDFQAVRNKSDLQCMAVPPKHLKMNTFYKYYSGEKTAPVLTIFIGGNHEASNYLQELPYGGWVAPKIYYLGYASVVQFGGIRIGGLSGIHKGHDYLKGHFEHPPYNDHSKRSAYHVRGMEVFRLKQLKKHVDIFISHDWPRGIHRYGNVTKLLRQKKFFADDIEKNALGSPAAEDLLYLLQPSYWFAAHLHVKFPALLQHSADSDAKITKFLALDKCLPRRQFMQVLELPHDSSKELKLELDPEWLAILKSTNHLFSLSKGCHYPGSGIGERADYKPTDEEVNAVITDFGGVLTIPGNFEQTVPAFDPSASGKKKYGQPQTMINPQTTLICSMLDLIDPNAVFLGKDSTYKLPEEDNSIEGASDGEDDEIDDESEQSFISLSGSEQSFSDRSFSLLSQSDSFVSTANESYSTDNADKISAEDSVNLIEPEDELNDEKDINEMQDANSQKQIRVVTPTEKLTLKKSTSIEEFSDLVAAKQKAKLKLNLSQSSASSSESEEKEGAKVSSLSDSSLECKYLEISDDDPELQEMLKLQRSHSTFKVDEQNPADNKVIEMSADDDELEFQEIVAAQKKNQETIPDIQPDFDMKPAYQSSPAVSLDDRVEQSLNAEISPKSAQKRDVLKMKTFESPMMKKFKRRNSDIYFDDSLEEEKDS